MKITTTDVQTAVDLAPGSNAFIKDSLHRVRPVLKWLWENKVPWIIRKIINFIAAIEEYLDEDADLPPAYR